MSPLAVHHPIFHTERIPQNWYSMSKLKASHSQKWHDETHKWYADATRIISHLPYASKEGIELLHKQCISLLVVQHPNCRTERLPKIWSFVCTLRVNLGGKWHCKTPKWHIDAIISTSHLPHETN